MFRKRLLLILITCVACILGLFPVTASASIGQTVRVNSDVTEVIYDWRDSWDANQNNAYIDIVSGILDMQTEISVRDDYVNSEQLMNVVRRVSQELSILEWVGFDDVEYTDAGYADKVIMFYRPDGDADTIRKYIHDISDYSAFIKSYLDPTMTDLEKALFLHDFIAQRTLYSSDSRGVLLDHKGTCIPVSKVYQELLYSAGIPYANASGHLHFWTNIYIDGKWYVSDATFDECTGEEELRYYPAQHDYFLCGTEKHYEDSFLSYFDTTDPAKYCKSYKLDNVEYNNPADIWDLSDSIGNLAYHVNDGESHGSLFYLTSGNSQDKKVLTSRDSMYSNAEVTRYPENTYKEIASAHDTLYGLRDNVIYTIDWNTLEETRIGYLQDNLYNYTGGGNSVISSQEFEKEVSGITGIIADNGMLSAQVTYADGTTDEFTACTYDKVEAFPEEALVKADLSGPSQEPGDVFYGFLTANYLNVGNVRCAVKGVSDSFCHTDGYTLPDTVSGVKIAAINENAFKDIGPDQLAGNLKFNDYLYEIRDHAFENCTGISGDLDISGFNSGEYAFSGCTGLDGTVTLELDSPIVTDYLLKGCSGIKKVENLENKQSIGQSAFDGCTSLTGNYYLMDGVYLGYNCFRNCENVEIPHVLKTYSINDYTFENCTKITGELSIPDTEILGRFPFKGSGITRLTNTDKVKEIGRSLLQGTQLTGILDFPALTLIKIDAFMSAGSKVTAIRFTNPETVAQNNSIGCFPYNADIPLFVVKDSPLEDVIRQKYVYGVNYWYVDDVIASGELENGLTWSIGADGIMHMGTADGAADRITVSGYDGEAAPWDEYKKFVETLSVESEQIAFGSGAICDFANLHNVTMVNGCTYEEDSFVRCGYLPEENIIVSACAHVEEIIPAKAATCTETGLTEGKKCSKCGEVLLAQEEVQALGHDPVHHEAKAATCTEAGSNEYWSCSRCPKLFSDAACEHEITEEETAVAALGHDPVHHEAKAATCTEAGSNEYWSCSRCPKLFSDEACEHEITENDTVIEALGHDPVHHEAKAATCTEAGNIEYWSCSRCPKLFSDEACEHEISEEDTVVEALGHDPVHHEAKAATCTEAGNNEYWSCSRCPKLFSDEACEHEITEEETVVAALGHDPVHHEAKATTCTDAGNNEYWSCSRCPKLFSEESCEHEITEEETVVEALGHDPVHHEAKAATCTEAGSNEYWSCNRCPKLFSDEACEHEITEEETVVAALGHDPVHHEAKAATCTEAGWEAYDTCSRCDYTTYKEIKALGHDLIHHEAKAATCTDAGWETYDTCSRCDYTTYKEIKALGHDIVHHAAKAATCTEAGWEAYDTCSRCDYTTYKEIKALGHDIVHHEAKAATCTDAGWEAYDTCSRCDYTTYKEIKALGHDLIHHEDKAATCTEAGSNEYWSCSSCPKLFSDEACEHEISEEDTVIEALGHDLIHHEAKAATCTEAGSNEYWSCSRCPKLFSDEACEHEISEEDTVIEALGHDPVHHEAKAATCTEAGSNEYWSCSRCPKLFSDEACEHEITEEETVVAALGHDPVHHEAKAATCTNAGWEAYDTCSRCDYTTYKEIKALGHDIVHHEAKAATCTEAGWEAYDTCSRCDYTTYKEIKALGHDIVHHEAKTATCTDAGWEAYDTCSRCDYTTYKEIKSLGHKPVTDPAEDPTCTEPGKTAGSHCSVCNEVLEAQEEIQALGHEWGDWEVVREATTENTGLKERKCKNCCASEQQEIARLAPEAAQAPALPEIITGEVSDKNPVAFAAVDKQILMAKSDADQKGSSFGLLKAKGVAKSAKMITVSWKKIPGATAYVIYGNRCGKSNKYKKIRTVSGTSFTQKKLKKGKYYKYVVVAINGDKAIAISKTIHVATKGGKVGNSKSVTTNAKKNKVTLKKGKSFSIKTKAIPQSAKLKVKKHRAIAYESSNKDIATVSRKGVIKARGKGTCKVFVYTQNGVSKAIKVTVK